MGVSFDGVTALFALDFGGNLVDFGRKWMEIRGFEGISRCGCMKGVHSFV